MKFYHDAAFTPTHKTGIYVNTLVITCTLKAQATSNSPVCEGETIELYGSVFGGTPPYTYTWKGPDSWTITNTQNPTRPNATLAMSGTYTLIVTDTHSCSDSDTTDVIVEVITATADSNSPVCLGDTIYLSATVFGGIPPYTYTWKGPDSWTITNTQNPTRPNATLAMSGTYTLIVTDTLGCSDSDMTDVVVHVITATAYSNSPVCLGDTIELSATVSGGVPPYTYTWKGPDSWTITNTQNPTRPNATLAMSGTYTLIVTDTLGCTDSDTTEVIVYDRPVVTATSNSSVCLGETIELSATVFGGTPPYTYTWKGPDGWTITNTQNPTRTATLDMSGTYTLIVTDTHGCCDSDTTDVIVYAKVCYCCSPGHSIYRIDASLFSGYTTTSAADSSLIRVTSPPAPSGWNQPDFEPDSFWQTSSEVWWDDWKAPNWVSPLLYDCEPIGLLDEHGDEEAVNGTTHLHRQVFTLSPPAACMQVITATLEMWSDNKTEWWWGGGGWGATCVSYGKEGYIGQVDLFPLINPDGGTYVLAIQNSNDYVCSCDDRNCNPHGTACRLCVSWIPTGKPCRYIYLPLVLKAHP
jgi:sarcosine oxidase gamma subunit